MTLTAKQLERIKAEYFRVQSQRTGIPVKFYELPTEVIEAYEHEQLSGLSLENREEYMKRKVESEQIWPGRLCPRYGRRATGDFSLMEWDGPSVDD